MCVRAIYASLFTGNLRPRRISFLFFYFLPVGALPLPAQTPAPKKSSPPVWRACAPGITLRLSAPSSPQGSLLLAELRSAAPLADLHARWAGQDVVFWQSGDSAPMTKQRSASGPVLYRALLGVDLERAPGDAELRVSAAANPGAASCRAVVSVKTGKFAVERLRVAPQFVEPGPEQLQRAEEERRRLREIFATSTPDRLWHGSFRIPLDGVQSGGNFGRRRVLNGLPGSPHGGVDFPAVTGTPVHAAQRGRVALAAELYFSGNTVILDHGLGIYTFYGHLNSIAVKEGNFVEPGALLGQVGATGRVTGPHLHWGLTVNRARVNPLMIVRLLPPD